MPSAYALGINSGKFIFISRLSRPAGRSKRIFTGGVVTASGICSAAFCESAALRNMIFSRENGIAERPQAFRYPEIKNLIPLKISRAKRRIF